MTSILHGGDLNVARQHFGDIDQTWLDLSTGISPWSWPVDTIPDAIWRNLPTRQEGLLTAASKYYDCQTHQLLPIAGSQIMIRLLPILLSMRPSSSPDFQTQTASQRIAIPHLGYQEHRFSWQIAGYNIVDYHDIQHLEELVGTQQVDHIVIINPNNPSTEQATISTLLTLRKQLCPSALMLIDEAFIDNQPQHSCSTLCAEHDILILRSIGKFFGLAGLRLGFLIGQGSLFNLANTILQPWSVNGAALHIAEQALLDTTWQAQQRCRIAQQQDELLDDLSNAIKQRARIKSAGLFTSIFAESDFIQHLYQHLGKQGILVRHSGDSSTQWCRLGLPGNDQQQQRLRSALAHL
ncbi:MAG: aminotransferase class I/II-fold pyridoxal phosphate-dependent enzyme [Arenicella sp.]